MIEFFANWLTGAFYPLSIIELACFIYVLKNTVKLIDWFINKIGGKR